MCKEHLTGPQISILNGQGHLSFVKGTSMSVMGTSIRMSGRILQRATKAKTLVPSVKFAARVDHFNGHDICCLCTYRYSKCCNFREEMDIVMVAGLLYNFVLLSLF